MCQAFFAERGFSPRPFQQESFEIILGGRNLLLVAGTAQGKTEAAVAPIAGRLIEGGRQFSCCYIAPTRALLNDLYGRLEIPLARLMLRAVIRHGDRRADPGDPDVDLLLTTPESLDILLGQRAPILNRVRIVVLDEVHQLYGTPRGAHVVSLLERLKWTIDRDKREPLQRVALSATVGDPTAVATWLGGSDGTAKVIMAPTTRAIDAEVQWSETDGATAQRILQAGHRKLLVFVNSRARCEELASALAHLSSSDSEIFVHYSDLDVRERTYVEDRFRRTERAICIATGTLELGIDIGTIDGVAMADPPLSVQAFLQRLGRAARRETTVPVLLVAGSEVVLAHQLALLSLATRGAVEDNAYPEWFSVLAQQVLSLVWSSPRKRIYERLPIEIFDSWPWFHATASNQLLGGLVAADFLEREERLHSYRQARNLALAADNWGISSNIDAAAAGLPVYHGRHRIGAVDLTGLAEGDVLRYAGRFWRIMTISDRGATVEATTAVHGARVPRWSGRWVGGLSRVVAQEMRALIVGGAAAAAELDDRAAERWGQLRQRVASLPHDPDTVWEYSTGSSFTYYTFAGDLENDVLCLLLDEDGLAARRTRGRTIGGISLEAKRRLRFPPRTEDVARRVEAEHWRGLRAWAQTGPYFGQLPAALRRREVLSQVGGSALIERVQRARTVVQVRSPVFQ